MDPVLDALFKSSAGTRQDSAKRSREAAAVARAVPKAAVTEKEVEEATSSGGEDDHDDATTARKRRKKRKRDDVLLEDLYQKRLVDRAEPATTSKRAPTVPEHESAAAAQPVTVDDGVKDNDDSDDDEGEDKALVHESAKGDAELDKAKATVFVGNLPVSVITSSTEHKAFKRLLSEHGKVKSIRFRSIAFSELLPRRVAFMQGKLHPERDTANAYVVYGDATSARAAITALNGHFYKGEKHLRFDSVAHPAPHDPKRSLFIGNLDFDAQDESLWRHFAKAGAIESVRVVRDAKTNVGKGFGYVQYKDEGAVANGLLLDGQKLDTTTTTTATTEDKAKKGKSRPLRVTRATKHGSLYKSEQRSRDKLKHADALRPRDKAKLGRVRNTMGAGASAKLRREIALEGKRASEGLPGARKVKKKSSGSLARSKMRASKYRREKAAAGSA